MLEIENNINQILNEIHKIHKESAFAKLSIPKLVAVSKKQEDIKIMKALKMGHRYFGENRVQEAQQRWSDKIPTFKDIELRLIGPLQTNKVKLSLELFDIIETIDREKLANSIGEQFNKNVKTKKFYIQINTGMEVQKSGIEPLQSDNFIDYCIQDLKLPIVGLMCVPPINEEPCMHFALLKKIAERNNLKELSMGMSNDYKEAIKFGATSVRIGSLIFGERKKN